MQIEQIPAEETEFVYHELLINDLYVISLYFTIMGSTRVILRHKDSYSLALNWCAGKKPADAERLINVMLELIERDDVDKVPFCSQIKPYFNDPAFMEIIRPYDKQYLSLFKDAISGHRVQCMLNVIKQFQNT